MAHGAYEQGIAAAAWAADLAHRDVTVVGAGVAGLAAAQHLTTHGITTRVWEAVPRSGDAVYPVFAAAALAFLDQEDVVVESR